MGFSVNFIRKNKDLVKREIGNIFIGEPREFKTALDLETLMDVKEREQKLQSLFKDFIIPFSKKALTKQGINELAEQGEIEPLPAVKEELEMLKILMGTTITLLKVIQELDTLDKDNTIYVAKPWTENSIVMVLPEPEVGGAPQEADELRLKYFIKVSVARKFLTDWEANLNKTPTIHEKCERLIQYATTPA